MMAEEELKHKIELFNTMARTCFDRCVDKKYKDVELYIGEISCINRCVSKYVQVYNIIGQTIASNRPTL